MRRVWGWVGVFVCAALQASTPRLAAPVAPDASAVVNSAFELELLVTPHAGDAGTRLAKRVTSDAANWPRLRALNEATDKLSTEKPLRVPFTLLRPELKLAVVQTLFPNDKRVADGWSHRVTTEVAGEGESLWAIAAWFTGDPSNYAAIRRANAGHGLATRRGETLLIPNELLVAPFARSEADVHDGATPASTAARASNAKKKNVASDVAAKPAHDDDGSTATATKAPPHSDVPDSKRKNRKDEEVVEETADASSAGPRAARASDAPARETVLTFEERDGHRYAIYRLQRGEAIYSSVAVRFTGRVYAKDVNDAVDAIVKASGVGDVARIAVNAPIRIPVELLTPEYLPSDDQRHVEYESSKRASSRAARRVEAKNLRGVVVILDAGHGGRDVGTLHGDVWESTYAYDVVCRLKRLIEKKSAATVRVTTKSSADGYEVSREDRLENRTDHVVLTTPQYSLDDPVVGVHLRWYLANAWYRAALAGAIAPEKVIFLSLHADSLHPSLRGAMAYIPGQQYSTGSFRKSGKVYLSRAEVREHPVVSQSEDEALRAEGLSRELAESVISSMEDSGLPVHDFNPVRENVVRDGKEWVPAVIRYNKVPTRMLLEICNLGNDEDRDLLETRKYREKLATAIFQGIESFFSRGDAGSDETTKIAASR